LLFGSAIGEITRMCCGPLVKYIAVAKMGCYPMDTNPLSDGGLVESVHNCIEEFPWGREFTVKAQEYDDECFIAPAHWLTKQAIYYSILCFAMAFHPRAVHPGLLHVQELGCRPDPGAGAPHYHRLSPRINCAFLVLTNSEMGVSFGLTFRIVAY
jgi:hypothetical protein